VCAQVCTRVWMLKDHSNRPGRFNWLHAIVLWASCLLSTGTETVNTYRCKVPNLIVTLNRMRFLAAGLCRFTFCISGCFAAGNCHAQDLAPRAYLVSPVHSNAVTLTYSLFDGSIIFDGNTPITDSTARVHIPAFIYSHSLSFFGRTANFNAALPYGVGNFRGKVAGTEALAHRSGLLAPTFRFSVNLKGGPAMNAAEFRKWRQKTILGVSFKLVPLAGQYDPTKLINLGTNRFAFKPEFGYSQRWGHWILDAYGGVWFFTQNKEFFSQNQSSPNTQSQSPVGSFEGHLSYDFKPRLWVSLDGNYWFGGATSVNGVENQLTLQRNSRVGVAASIPLTAHQSLKFSYSNGAYIRYGGNYQNISVAWQYSWLGRPD
jgi:hypothetical protein